MTRLNLLIFLMLGAIVVLEASATVPIKRPVYASYRNVTLGFSTEAELLKAFGKPQRRVVSDRGVVDLYFSSPFRGIKEIHAIVASGKYERPSVEQLFIVFRTAQDADEVLPKDFEARFWKSIPRKSIPLSDGLPCYFDYFEKMLMGLGFCDDGKAGGGQVVAHYLSQRLFRKMNGYGGGKTITQLKEDFERRAAGINAADILNWSFTLDDVIEVAIAVEWPTTNSEYRPVHSTIRHEGSRFMQDGQPVDADRLVALGASLSLLGPVPDLQDCTYGSDDRQGHEILHPVIDIAIQTANRGVLKLRSGSECAFKLPWNVTNGKLLAATGRVETGQAIRDLLMPICRLCLFKQQPLPNMKRHDLSQNSFMTLFDALLSDWSRRSGISTAARDPHTEHLMATLNWMDGPRLLEELKKIFTDEEAPYHLRAIVALELAKMRGH